MISTAHLAEITHKIKGTGINEDAVLGSLRTAYPAIHFTYCMDDDIGSFTPAVSESDFNLYLVDGREHCLCLTQDAQIATGIVVAEIVAD
jgi:hypothetical protein